MYNNQPTLAQIKTRNCIQGIQYMYNTVAQLKTWNFIPDNNNQPTLAQIKTGHRIPGIIINLNTLS